MGFHVIDATKSIEAQQREMRRIVVRELGAPAAGSVRHGGNDCPRPSINLSRSTRLRFRVDIGELQGKLIVIEGPDAVGRSTQVRMLKTMAGGTGHAVLDTGMARSALAGKASGRPKRETFWVLSP